MTSQTKALLIFVLIFSLCASGLIFQQASLPFCSGARGGFLDAGNTHSQPFEAKGNETEKNATQNDDPGDDLICFSAIGFYIFLGFIVLRTGILEKKGKALDPEHRCARCGRMYSKARWMKGKSWCKKCQNYICTDCEEHYGKCPACGSKTTQPGALAIVGGLVCSLMLPLAYYLYFTNGLLTGFIFPFILVNVLLALAVNDFLKLRQAGFLHAQALQALPPGVIPVEERKGYQALPSTGQPGESERGGGPDQGTGQGVGQHPISSKGVKGQWRYPILTLEESIVARAQTRERAKIRAPLFIVPGLGLFYLYFAFIPDFLFLGLGAAFLISGVLSLMIFLPGNRLTMQAAETDILCETTVDWKAVGYQQSQAAIQGFLREMGKPVQEKLDSSLKVLMWTNPKHIYTLEHGMRIVSLYLESADKNYSSLVFQYDPHYYDEAKQLHEELDRYLTDRDLIRRVHERR